MTDLRQAAQQALEALIDAANVLSAPMFADAVDALRTALEQQAEPVSMRMPKVGDKVICLEDESLGEVVSLTGGGSPDITFDDGSRGTYLLREFAELFGYVAAPQQQAEPVAYYHPRNGFYWAKPTSIFAPTVVDVPPIPLYTTPPKRPWAGLTDEDWEQIHDKKGTALDTFAQGAVWAADQLKEKNT